MPFGKLTDWGPNLTHVDPRASEKYSVGAKYCVISVTKHPTYAELQSAGKTVADSHMCGLIRDFYAPQMRPIMALFELGSKYPYSVAGKFRGNIHMTSMLFDAASNIIGSLMEEVYSNDDGTLTAEGIRLLNAPILYDNGQPTGYSMKDVGGGDSGIVKNFGATRLSLDDNALDAPFGLILTIFQSGKRIRSTGQDAQIANGIPGTPTTTFRIMSCLFFEMSRIQTYDFQLNAEQEFISEAASLYYVGLINVKTALQSIPDQVGERTVIEPIVQ